MTPDTYLIDSYDAFGFNWACRPEHEFEADLAQQLADDGLASLSSPVRQRCQKAARRGWWNEQTKRNVARLKGESL